MVRTDEFRTPTSPADCLFGDQWEVLDWHEGAGRKIPCDIYLNHHGSGVCSSEGVRQLCCQSCAEQREDNNPGELCTKRCDLKNKKYIFQTQGHFSEIKEFSTKQKAFLSLSKRTFLWKL